MALKVVIHKENTTASEFLTIYTISLKENLKRYLFKQFIYRNL